MATIEIIGKLSLTRQFETFRMLAAYKRTVGGSGSAVLSVRDSVNLNLTQDLSEKLSIGAGISAYTTRALDNETVTFDNRNYYQVGGLLEWNVARSFSIDFDYRYTFIDRDVSTSKSDSNQLNLWFRYRRVR